MSEIVSKKDDKQQLKKDRIKEYFLSAAKNMVMQGGVESVTVRSVADKAGYSYATLYNYFEDLNSLLWQTKLSIMWDVFAWMNQSTADLPGDISGIKKMCVIYMSYYLEHPNVYFFLFRFKATAPKTEDIASLDTNFDAVIREAFKNLALACKLREDDIPLVYKLLIYLINGLLSLHFSGNIELTPTMAVDEMNQIIDYIFNRKVNEI